MTQNERVFNALVVKGESLTAKQIGSRFRLANPYDAIYKLRRAGYNIDIRESVDTKGRVKTKYSFNKGTTQSSGKVAVAR